MLKRTLRLLFNEYLIKAARGYFKVESGCEEGFYFTNF
jgi:hypothetical protein